MSNEVNMKINERVRGQSSLTFNCNVAPT